MGDGSASEAAADPSAALPSESWTVAEIREYASSRGIDLPQRGRKAELLEAIKKEG